MSKTPHDGVKPLRLSALADRSDQAFLLVPDAEARAGLAAALDLSALRKLRFEGRLVPEGKRDWRLEARLGATVVQPCRVTLAPVTTRIDEEVTRRYVAHLDEPEGGGEVEMPEDDTLEAIPQDLDLAEVMTEALALALPAFPRAEGAEPGDALHAAPGTEPMTDADIRPFAALKSLKDKLDGKG